MVSSIDEGDEFVTGMGTPFIGALSSGRKGNEHTFDDPEDIARNFKTQSSYRSSSRKQAGHAGSRWGTGPFNDSHTSMTVHPPPPSDFQDFTAELEMLCNPELRLMPSSTGGFATTATTGDVDDFYNVALVPSVDMSQSFYLPADGKPIQESKSPRLFQLIPSAGNQRSSLLAGTGRGIAADAGTAAGGDDDLNMGYDDHMDHDHDHDEERVLSLQILIVDDSALQRKISASKLGGKNGDEVWLVKTAENGEQALHMFELADSLPDVIIIDERMEDTGGVLLGHEVVKSIRHRPGFEKVIIIGKSLIILSFIVYELRVVLSICTHRN